MPCLQQVPTRSGTQSLPCAMLGVKPCCQNPVYLLARPGTCMWASDPAHSCLLLHSGAALGTLTKSPGCEWQWLLCYPVQEPMPVPWRVGARSQPCARQAGQPRGPGARNLSPHTLLAWEEGRLLPPAPRGLGEKAPTAATRADSVPGEPLRDACWVLRDHVLRGCHPQW